LRGHELAAVAADFQTPVARRSVQGQAGNYVGGTLPDRGAGAEPDRKAFYQLAWHLSCTTAWQPPIAPANPMPRGGSIKTLKKADDILKRHESDQK